MDTRISNALPVTGKNVALVCLYLALAASLVLSLAAAAGAANTIKTEVEVSKSSVLTLPGPVSRVSVADPEIADIVVISPREVQILGKKVGSTSLIVWDRAGTKTFFDVKVLEPVEPAVDLTNLKKQIAEIAPGDPINYQWINSKTLVLTGEVKTEERKGKITNVMLGFGKDITETEIYILQGGVVKEARSAGVGLAGEGYNFVNLLEVTDPIQVLLQITAASIDRNATRELGINWAVVRDGLTIDSAVSSLTGGLTDITGLGADGVTSATLDTEDISGATFSVVDFRNGAQYLLKALASKGLAKVLAEPNLLVKSGESGRFLAGGEVPVPIVTTVSGGGGGNAVTVEYKEFGVKLNFKPLVTEAGLIKLAIDPVEVSTIAGLDVQVSGFSLPSFNTNRVSTSVDLREGESFIIAGILNSEWKKNMSKLPILGDIPILGAFFRTQDLEKNERELVFIVTPKLMSPMAPGERAILPGSNEPTMRQEEDLRWIPMLPTYRSMDPEQVK